MAALPLTRRAFLRRLDRAAVEAAIQRAERRTSGEIRVAVSGLFWGNPQRVGERAFRRLGMHATRHRNGVLILVAPTRRKLIVLGDTGIHARVGDPFWSGLHAAVAGQLRAGDFTGGLVSAVEAVGRELALHFPPDPSGDVDELPNKIDV